MPAADSAVEPESEVEGPENQVEPGTYVTTATFNTFLEGYEAYKMEDETRHENLMAAIEKLTVATQGVVDAWTFANNFNKFLKWVASLGVLGTGVLWLLDKFK